MLDGAEKIGSDLAFSPMILRPIAQTGNAYNLLVEHGPALRVPQLWILITFQSAVRG
jgi:hypothetical protein